MDFVRGHRFAIARSAKDHAPIAFPARDRFRRRSYEERVVNRLFVERAEVLYLMA